MRTHHLCSRVAPAEWTWARRPPFDETTALTGVTEGRRHLAPNGREVWRRKRGVAWPRGIFARFSPERILYIVDLGRLERVEFEARFEARRGQEYCVGPQ